MPLIFFRKRRCSCNSNDTSIDRAGPFNRMQPSTNSLASKSPLPADIGQLFCDDSVIWLMVQMVQWGSQNTGDKWCRYILFNHPLPGLRCNFMTGWCFFCFKMFFSNWLFEALTTFKSHLRHPWAWKVSRHLLLPHPAPCFYIQCPTTR